MNSILTATPPPPRHFHDHPIYMSMSPPRPTSSFMSGSGGNTTTTGGSGGLSRKRKAEDDASSSHHTHHHTHTHNNNNNNNDHDTRMSASPTHSPSAPAPAPAPSSSSSSYPRTTRSLKKPRPNIHGRPLSVPRLLETLDTDTLRSVLRSLCDRHPDLASEIVHTSPRPSVSSALQVLGKYYTTLRSSFPLGSNPGSDYAYNRVRPHIANLLDALNDFTPHFLPPHETQAAVSLAYLDGATEIINRLPKWESPQNNVDRDAAYEEMARAWTVVVREAARRGGGIGLRHGEWDQKLVKHDVASGGKLREAVEEMRGGLSWMMGDVGSGVGGLGGAGAGNGGRRAVRNTLLHG